MKAYKQNSYSEVEELMDSKYRWKNGRPPTPDEAAQSQHLLDESQFSSEDDWRLAEENARRHLGVPIPIPDDEVSVLPHAQPLDEDEL